MDNTKQLAMILLLRVFNLKTYKYSKLVTASNVEGAIKVMVLWFTENKSYDLLIVDKSFMDRNYKLYNNNLCLIVYSGVHHILCCVFALFVFVLCTPSCQFLWIVHS